MKFATIVGARPQFVKTALISNILRESHEEILIHTGQHYDFNMSDVFFKELQIPMPDYHLGIGSGTHGAQTGQMLEKIESVFMLEKPDMVVIYGDTNSTLAGALAAVKLHIPVAHVEAGLRSFNRKMPEEINRELSDRISSLLLCPTETAVNNLKNEGISNGVFNVGDVMFDILKKMLPVAEKSSSILETLGLLNEEYFLVTLHRAENTKNIDGINSLLLAIRETPRNFVWPIHPRTKKIIEDYGVDKEIKSISNLLIIEPVGYLDMLSLLSNAEKVLTDSGGIQKEAFWLGRPCITLRNETEWVETVAEGWNILTGLDVPKIIAACREFKPNKMRDNVFGDGKASNKVVEKLLSYSF